MDAPTRYLLTLALSVVVSLLTAQSDSTYLSPVPGLPARELAGMFMDREWSDEQEAYLRGQLVQIEFRVSPSGSPSLLAVAGVDRLDVIDSLRAAAAELGNFTPARREGVAVGSSYTQWMVFPDYGTEGLPYESIWLETPVGLTTDSLQDHYTRLSDRGYLDVNLSYVHHYGTVGSFLKDGGGFDLLLGSHWNDRWGAGVLLAFEINGRHRPFPEDRFPDRNRETSGGFGVGGTLHFSPYTGRRLRVTLRPEIGYGSLNAANRLDPDAEEGLVQYRGAHFGLVAQATLRTGDYRPQTNYGREEVVAQQSAINLFAGIRHRYYGDRVGTGTFLVAGVGYRFAASAWQPK